MTITTIPVNNSGLNLIDQIDTQIRTKVMQSGRQTARRLIIFRRRYTPGILLCAYSYAGSSNFGRFGQILWRIIRPVTEALLWAKAAQGQAQSISKKNRRGRKCCCVGLSFRRTIVTFCQFLINPNFDLETEYIAKTHKSSFSTRRLQGHLILGVMVKFCGV